MATKYSKTDKPIVEHATAQSGGNALLVEMTSSSSAIRHMGTGAYFNSLKRSGGGDIKYLQPWKTGSPGTFLLEFEEPEVAGSVLKRNHHGYKVQQFQPPDAYDEITASIKDSVGRALLRNFNEDFNFLKDTVENVEFLGVRMSQTESGSICVQGNLRHLSAFNDYIATNFPEEQHQASSSSALETPPSAAPVEEAVNGNGISDDELDDSHKPDGGNEERELTARVEKMDTGGADGERDSVETETNVVADEPWMTGRSASSAPIVKQPVGQILNEEAMGAPMVATDPTVEATPGRHAKAVAKSACDRSIHEYVKTTKEYADLIDNMPDGSGIQQEDIEDQPMLVNLVVEANTAEEADHFRNEYDNIHIQIGGGITHEVLEVNDTSYEALQKAFQAFRPPEGFTYSLLRNGKIKITAPHQKMADARAQINWQLESVRQQATKPNNHERQSSAGGVEHSDPLMFEFGLLVVKVYKADITRLNVDAIVNAANGRLQHDGGVARAIARAAGEEFEREGQRYYRQNGELHVGQVYRQRSQGNLQKVGIKSVIHAIGPSWSYYGENDRVPKLLHSAVLRALEAANLYEHRSIALPAISSGIYRVPLDLCAKTYREAVVGFVKKFPTAALKEIHFVDISDETLKCIANEFASPIEDRSEGKKPSKVKGRGRGEVIASLSQVAQTPAGLKAGGQRKPSGKKDQTKEERLNPSATAFDPNSFSAAKSRSNGAGQNQKPSTQVDSHRENRGGITLTDSKKGASKTLGLKDTDLAEVADNAENARREEAVSDGRQTSTKHAGPDDAHTRDARRSDNEDGPNSSETTHHAKHSDDEKKERRRKPSTGSENDKSSQNSRSSRTDGSSQRKDERVSLNVRSDGSREDYTSATDPQLLTETGQPSNEKTGSLKKSSEDADSLDQRAATRQGASGGTRAEQEKAVIDCPICCEPMNKDTVFLLACQHLLCKKCAQNMTRFRNPPKCPSCNVYFAVNIGKQPDGGRMDTQENKIGLPGYERYGTIVINYNVPNCTQQEYHPNPGVLARGTSRVAYLPANPRGKKLARMLRKAFNQKLLFTVDRSVTSNIDNIVVWNDIHHKTSTFGDYGYPDPSYLDRLEAELNDKGIYDDTSTV